MAIYLYSHGAETSPLIFYLLKRQRNKDKIKGKDRYLITSAYFIAYKLAYRTKGNVK